ncbi:hypothetical protein [Tsukamurella sp. NPDC003166]|uniref:lytic transglycosylase domain-containing protein n=1 Tax=Tsukamurella sp. NPDC003166 TaxID=3154444 RepID=UPI0033A844ED
MRILGAGAAAGAAALLLGVAGADAASIHSPAPARTTGPELVAQAAIGIADLRPPAPSDAPTAPAPRHVPIPPRPEAVKVAPGPLGIPGAAYAAYQAAADRMALEAPACGIEWSLVAAIGRIESGHADGGNVDAAGRTLTPIEGPVLDGTLAGNAVVRDGAGYARALGPMQFLSTTWALFGGDNSGDGRADVDNVRDAAYGAARYLCSSASGLQSQAQQRVAVFAYNQSNSYVDNVVAWAKAYKDRAIPVGGIPDMTAPVAPPKELPKPLPPGQVVIVGCGTPDGAVRPSGARPSTPSAKPTPSPPVTRSAKPSGPAAPSSAALGAGGKPLPTVVDCPGPVPSPPGAPSSGPAMPTTPAPIGPGGALAIAPSGPATGASTAAPAPSSVRPAAPSARPAPSSRPAAPSSSPTVPRPPR